MVDPPNDSNAEERPPERRPEAAPSTPRWVIVLGILALILIIAVVAQFVAGVQHGPGLHGS